MQNQEGSLFYCLSCRETFEDLNFIQHFGKCEICNIHNCAKSLQRCADCEELCCEKCFHVRNLCTDCTPTCSKCQRLILYDQEQENYEMVWADCQLCNSKTDYLCKSCRYIRCDLCLKKIMVCFLCQTTKDICPHTQEEREENKQKQEKKTSDDHENNICRPS